MTSVHWEDYIITGEQTQEAAEFMERFLMAMFPDPEDRLYMDENYFSVMAHKIEEAKAKFDVEFTLDVE